MLVKNSNEEDGSNGLAAADPNPNCACARGGLKLSGTTTILSGMGWNRGQWTVGKNQ